MTTPNNLYICSPNAIMFCVNAYDDYQVMGEYYYSYSREGVPIRNLNELFNKMGDFFDDLAFPYETTTVRAFKNTTRRIPEKTERIKVMDDKELLNKHGDLGTFLINVQHRQNSSWQGKITWLDRNETVNFRSVWELARLINSAIEISTESKFDLPEWTEEKKSEE